MVLMAVKVPLMAFRPHWSGLVRSPSGNRR